MSWRSAVLVTGGTGFVGSAVVRGLLERGDAVHVLARDTSRREALSGLDVVWHVGDLTDAASLDSAVGAVRRAATQRGCPARVVHSAARISYRPEDAELSHLVNVRGTENVLDACVENDISRLVFVSSVVAVGQAGNDSTELNEDAAFNGHALGSAYVTTKRAAEELVLSRADALDVVVVNPGAVFGPALESSNTTRFLARVARGRIAPPAAPGSLAVVGVDDVANGIALSLERGVRGRRYILTESNWRMRELLTFVMKRLGRSGLVLRLPRPMWRTIVATARLIDRVRPFEVASPEALKLLGEHYRFDSSRARNELGWKPRPFETVLNDTLEWMGTRELLS